ncbi:MBL fold metallo-hydrolase [Sulfolobales archaeon HS-7]|nr:MBL fold metallo-hydrolase [Sulfolobales archaeon HS-7]
MHRVLAGPIEFPEFSSVFVICDEKVVVIDGGVPNSTMDAGFLNQVDYLVITHAHVDHLGTLREIVSRYKPKILISEQEYQRMDFEKINSEGREIYKDLMEFFGEAEKVEGEFVIVDEDDEFPLGENTLRVIYSPGHSKGHISVMIGNFLYAGDALGAIFNGRYFPLLLRGSSREQYYSSIRKLLEYNPSMIGLSHGGLLPFSDVERSIKENSPPGDFGLGGTAEEIARKFSSLFVY